MPLPSTIQLTYRSPTWLEAPFMWTTKQINNPPLKWRRFGCKLYALLLESTREFELVQRNIIFRFSIGWKGAHDDGSHFAGDW